MPLCWSPQSVVFLRAPSSRCELPDLRRPIDGHRLPSATQIGRYSRGFDGALCLRGILVRTRNRCWEDHLFVFRSAKNESGRKPKLCDSKPDAGLRTKKSLVKTRQRR